MGQHGRAMRDYCLARHVRPWSTLPVLLRARLHGRLEQMEEVDFSRKIFSFYQIMISVYVYLREINYTKYGRRHTASALAFVISMFLSKFPK